MPASETPKEMRMDGYSIGGEIYVKEADARRHIQTAFAANGNSTLLALLNGIISHWDEFGPEHGFDEVIDRARKVVNANR